MNRETKILIAVIVISVILAILAITSHLLGSINKLNVSPDSNRQINELALPLIKDSNKYIQKQTEEWYQKRANGEPCYAVLEKDKIIMSKWMEMVNVKAPKIHFYAYHDQFDKSDLERVIQEHGKKPLIIKISHLQSSFGIIKVGAKPSPSEVDKIYQQILDKFDTSFVCNHDSNDPPTNEQIREGKKTSYYKLYETIKPGVIIQDYFESYSDLKKVFIEKDGINTNLGKDIPIEIKVLMFGDTVIKVTGSNTYETIELKGSIYIDQKRYQPLVEEARKISKFLGATLVRVDFFVKQTDNPYVPYLNEISLSPNGGLKRLWGFSSQEINKMKHDIENSPRGDYSQLNKLIQECPFRDLPIKIYMTDADRKIINEGKYGN